MVFAFIAVGTPARFTTAFRAGWSLLNIPRRPSMRELRGWSSLKNDFAHGAGHSYFSLGRTSFFLRNIRLTIRMRYNWQNNVFFVRAVGACSVLFPFTIACCGNFLLPGRICMRLGIDVPARRFIAMVARRGFDPTHKARTVNRLMPLCEFVPQSRVVGHLNVPANTAIQGQDSSVLTGRLLKYVGHSKNVWHNRNSFIT